MVCQLSNQNATKLALVLVLSVSLSLIGIASLPIARAESTYPFKTVFEQDLATIARHTPHVVEIQVIQVFDMERTVVIRISYAPRISELKKIGIQNQVQEELQEKQYIQAVEKNLIVCIPEDMSCPPWPGFVIGELLVMFVDVPTDPFLHPWPDGSMLVASNVGTTNLTLAWTSTKDGSHTVAYRITWALQWFTVSNATHSMFVTGLKPGTIYDFRIDAINDVGDFWLGPSATVMTQTAPRSVPSPEPTPTPPPGTIADSSSNQIISSLLRYWYVLLIGASLTAIITIIFLRKRNPSFDSARLLPDPLA